MHYLLQKEIIMKSCNDFYANSMEIYTIVVTMYAVQLRVF